MRAVGGAGIGYRLRGQRTEDKSGVGVRRLTQGHNTKLFGKIYCALCGEAL